MNKIIKFTLDKEILKTISPKERAFIFTASHLSNEITSLYKLLLWTTTNTSKDKHESLGQTTYQFMFIRLLAGKLQEGYNFLSKDFNKKEFSKSYYGEMRESTQNSLSNLNKYFNNENHIRKIRNSFAFHYNSEKLDTAHENAPENFDFFIEQGGSANNLYYFGEIAAGRALLIESGDLEDAFVYQKLIKELIGISKQLTQVTDELISIFANRYFRDSLKSNAEEITFAHAPSLLEVSIPWFIDPTDAYKEIE